MANIPRLYTDRSLHAGCVVALNDNQKHYLITVLRLQSGALVKGFNGRDGEWLCRLRRSGGRQAYLDAYKFVRKQVNSPQLTLFFAPVTKSRTDFIVEKACELGARTICPVITAYTQTKIVRINRLRLVAIEAAEQTGRMDIPDIMAPLSLAEALNNWNANRPLYYCDEQGDAKLMQDAIGAAGIKKAGILVGPVGGFSMQERVSLRSCRFVRPITLGPRILRAETAVVSALAVWQSHVGDWTRAPYIEEGFDQMAGRQDNDDTLESD